MTIAGCLRFLILIECGERPAVRPVFVPRYSRCQLLLAVDFLLLASCHVHAKPPPAFRILLSQSLIIEQLLRRGRVCAANMLAVRSNDPDPAFRGPALLDRVAYSSDTVFGWRATVAQKGHVDFLHVDSAVLFWPWIGLL